MYIILKLWNQLKFILECAFEKYDISTSVTNFLSDGYAERLLETALFKERYPNIMKPELLISFEVFFPSLQTTDILRDISESEHHFFTSWFDFKFRRHFRRLFGASLLSQLEIIEFIIAASRIMAHKRRDNRINSNTHVTL